MRSAGHTSSSPDDSAIRPTYAQQIDASRKRKTTNKCGVPKSCNNETTHPSRLFARLMVHLFYFFHHSKSAAPGRTPSTGFGGPTVRSKENKVLLDSNLKRREATTKAGLDCIQPPAREPPKNGFVEKFSLETLCLLLATGVGKSNYL